MSAKRSKVVLYQIEVHQNQEPRRNVNKYILKIYAKSLKKLNAKKKQCITVTFVKRTAEIFRHTQLDAMLKEN